LLSDDDNNEEDQSSEGEVQTSSNDSSASNSTRTPQEKLDLMYIKILNNCLAERRKAEQKDFLKKVQRIVGSIMLLSEPMSAINLGSLLYGSYDAAKHHMDEVLGPLQSVIDSSPGALLAPLHLAFRDFLLSTKRCRKAPRYGVKREQGHSMLLDCCLKAMGNLREDICNLKRPGFRACDVPAAQVDQNMPRYVQYACCWWMGHLGELNRGTRPGVALKDDGPIHDFLREKFLHWLEALSLMRGVSVLIPVLKDLQDLVTVGHIPRFCTQC
jgi:hypothetical protein